MAVETGIPWTDSTYNAWHGCTEVGPACDGCYAREQDARQMKSGPKHWGPGVERRYLAEATRNAPFVWQRNADKFFAAHGRPQRVFASSMCDVFDNEVPDEWRRELYATIEKCDRLIFQMLTKRISNVMKMAPAHWFFPKVIAQPGLPRNGWPRHVGLMVTIVTQEEADRDIPRLLKLKTTCNIPWVGISYEPAQEYVNFRPWLGDDSNGGLDWIIFGGKSGPEWNDRPFDINWGRLTYIDCARAMVAFFMKQVASARPTDKMIPSDVLIRQFPRGEWTNRPLPKEPERTLL